MWKAGGLIKNSKMWLWEAWHFPHGSLGIFYLMVLDYRIPVPISEFAVHVLPNPSHLNPN